MEHSTIIQGIVALLDETMPNGRPNLASHAFFKETPEGGVSVQGRSPPESPSGVKIYAFTGTFNNSKKLRSVDHQKKQAFWDKSDTIQESNNDKIHADVKKYIQAYSKRNKCSIIFLPEYTKNLDLHYHGLVIADVHSIAQLKKYWQRHYGHTVLKEVFELQKWIEYMTKDWDQMRREYTPILHQA